jgi:secretion/DNA translocation related CpaE-like protein
VQPGPDRRPLLVVPDPEILDQLLGLAAAAGSTVDVASDLAAIRRWWSRAPMALIDLDSTEAVLVAGLPRRPGVVLVTRSGEDSPQVWRRAVDVGAERVVALPDGRDWLVERFAECVEPPATGRVIGVVGGAGGAGATVLTAALAQGEVRRGGHPLLIDLDPLGAGCDLVLGGDDADGLRWSDLADVRGRVNGASLMGALPLAAGVRVLTFDRDIWSEPDDTAARAVIGAGRRAADLTVVDLPRLAMSVSAAAACAVDTVLLVVPAQVRAVAAAAVVLRTVLVGAEDVRLVIRATGAVGPSWELVAETLGRPVAGVLRQEPRLAAVLERGDPPAAVGWTPLTRFCDAFLASRCVAGAAA